MDLVTKHWGLKYNFQKKKKKNKGFKKIYVLTYSLWNAKKIVWIGFSGFRQKDDKVVWLKIGLR